MALKTSSRFLIRPSKRLSEAAQRKFVVPGDVVYVIGKGETKRADWISSLRAGDLAKVSHAAIIAEPKSRRNPRDPIADLREAIDAICKTGAVVVEASTGFRSDDVCQVKDMILGAVQGIRSGRRGGSREQAGRPQNEWTPQQLDMFEREWNSRKNKTRADAIEAIRARFEDRKDKKRINLTAVRRALQRAGKI